MVCCLQGAGFGIVVRSEDGGQSDGVSLVSERRGGIWCAWD